jgi:hypothetical protein
MHVEIIEPTDQRWRDTLATIRHDFYQLPDYVSLDSARLGAGRLPPTSSSLACGCFCRSFVERFPAAMVSISFPVRLHPILKLPDGAFTGRGTLVGHGQTVSIDLRQNEAEQWHGIRARYRTSLNRSERPGPSHQRMRVEALIMREIQPRRLSHGVLHGP